MTAPVPPVFADLNIVMLSQYANSPVLRLMLENLSECIDPSANFDDFYDKVWNIESAEGWGLDVLGRRIGVNRVLQIPIAGTYLGFKGADDANPFGVGTWYGFGTATSSYPLPDTDYRRLLLAKAASNITDCSTPAINAILTALFPAYAPAYVKDSGGMAIIYHFGAVLSDVDYAIVTQSGALPKPVGVSFTVEP